MSLLFTEMAEGSAGPPGPNNCGLCFPCSYRVALAECRVGDPVLCTETLAEFSCSCTERFSIFVFEMW